jgi:hypothetical protein
LGQICIWPNLGRGIDIHEQGRESRLSFNEEESKGMSEFVNLISGAAPYAFLGVIFAILASFAQGYILKKERQRSEETYLARFKKARRELEQAKAEMALLNERLVLADRRSRILEDQIAIEKLVATEVKEPHGDAALREMEVRHNIAFQKQVMEMLEDLRKESDDAKNILLKGRAVLEKFEGSVKSSEGKKEALG